MARIGSYKLDKNITSADKVVGTDSSGAVTKNFNLADLGGFFSEGFVNVNGQHAWKFKDKTEMGCFTGPKDSQPLSTVTSIELNRRTLAHKDVKHFLSEYEGKRVLLVDVATPDVYGVFDVSSLNENPKKKDNFTVGLSPVSSNGVISYDKVYAISVYAQTRTYAWRQNSASTTWTIPHNLGKFPSVSLKFSSSDKVYENVGAFAGVDYVDKNNLTINLAAAESGYAYLN